MSDRRRRVFMVLVKRDPLHERPIVTGQGLADYLHRILSQIGWHVIGVLHANPSTTPDLSVFQKPLEQDETLLRWMASYYQHGIQQGRLELAKARTKSYHRKDAPDFSFHVFNPKVLEAIQDMIAEFAKSTLATAQTDMELAISEFKDSLGFGMQLGDTLKRLTQRTQQIFQNPTVAIRLAATESSRASHRGEQALWAESGEVESVRWLVSSDACDRCKKLAGKVVKLGETFYVDPKGGPYAKVFHPPLHPH